MQQASPSLEAIAAGNDTTPALAAAGARGSGEGGGGGKGAAPPPQPPPSPPPPPAAAAAAEAAESEEDLPELTGQLKWLYHLTTTKGFFKSCNNCTGFKGGECEAVRTSSAGFLNKWVLE
jgi:hypothetical protein